MSLKIGKDFPYVTHSCAVGAQMSFHCTAMLTHIQKLPRTVGTGSQGPG